MLEMKIFGFLYDEKCFVIRVVSTEKRTPVDGLVT